MRSSRSRVPKKLIAFLIVLGVAGLMCLGVFFGMKLRRSRRIRIRRESELSLAESAASAAEKAEELLAESEADSAESVPEEDPALLLEEERTAEELDEQTRRANRENAQILKGLRKIAQPNIGSGS